ncbi:hypothetical protein D6C79_10647 [Aureobasidium pullulans]|nr:hypothetical protein D6C79_10647 [Aureobasidium pullulans]
MSEHTCQSHHQAIHQPNFFLPILRVFQANYGQEIFYCDQIFNKDLIIEDHRLKQELIINQAFCDFIVISFANLKSRVILKQVFVIQIFD